MMYVCFIFLFTFSLNEIVLVNSCENDNCTSAIDIPLITHLNAPLKAELDISILTEQLKELIGHEVKQAVSTAMKDIVEKLVDKRARSAVENLQTFNNLTISTFLREMEDVTARKSDLRTMEENLNGRIEQMKEKQNLTESKLSAVEAEFERSTKRDVTARKNDLRTMEEKLEGRIEQMMEKQKLTESKLSAVVVEFERSTKRDVTARKNDVRIMEENLKKSIEQQKITESKLSSVEAQLKIAMTAHPSLGGTKSNTIMKFDDVKYSVSITNLSSYKTTGKFTCEHEGLYLISSSVMSHTSLANYYIILNGNDISQTYIGRHSGSKEFTGAVSLTRKLNQNDQVWLYASGSWYLYGGVFFEVNNNKNKVKVYDF
ncbi:unnamed protein product [Mytilus edulis]|uniref:C1q domain-containing protein n=1 Tax=Mytilus edulis TaxID=6550 RepID=A0A8S3Q145_MYTED|nr:unnamed protein product [Mytilus edulis]